MRCGVLAIDADGWVLLGRPVSLTPCQARLLAILVANRTRVLPREELAEALGINHPRSVDVMLCGLRRQCGGGFLRTVRGRGWILAPDAFEEEPARSVD